LNPEPSTPGLRVGFWQRDESAAPVEQIESVLRAM
jgi:hypothetical protein